MVKINPLSESDKRLVIDWYDGLGLCKDMKEVEDYYDRTRDIYDDVVRVVQLPYPAITTQLLETLEGENIGAKKIIDIGAGTGVLACEMKRRGFNHIDALDLSIEMLNIAKKKNVYGKLINLPLDSKAVTEIGEGTYDAAVSCGAFLEGHLPAEALFDMIRLVKPGGYIVYTMRDPNFKLNFMSVYGKAMEERKVELISMQFIPYKRECTINFDTVYAYLVTFKVL